MATRHEEMQAFIRYYKRENKKAEVTMAEIAVAAAKQGWPVPPPVTGIDRLAKQFSEAAREEIRYDKKTQRPYRANLAMTQRFKDGTQLALWIDTDEASRGQMVLAMNKYREQMVGEAVIGTNTVDHWNRTNPQQEPIPFPTDLSEEVEWRLNTPEEDAG